MKLTSSRLMLIDLQYPLYCALKLPFSSTLTYLSSSLRRSRTNHRAPVASRFQPLAVLRKPANRWVVGDGPIKVDAVSPSASSRSGELDLFLDMLPITMRRELFDHWEISELVEVVMDLGREPLARFPSGDWVISQVPVTRADLNHAMSKVGDFSDDNRSGINSSLHRISAIRNRRMEVIGLTCRVGRAVAGSAEVVRDLVEGGGSILVIGPPGVGKTTLIREMARMLADDQGRRVVIVDTSNEIGGDGDVPHIGIGRARRMQVPNVNMQHDIMIEAVENHMPQTIVIDEIGTELEAIAASTIAQRGVQLVGTAHGVTLENIIKNPSLQILVGGVESVTLGDEEARKRKVQKTVLERKGPPAFTCAVELISRTECRIHYRLDAAVDAILAGKEPLFEIRQMEAYDNNPSRSLPQLSHKDIEDKTDLLTIHSDKYDDIEMDKRSELLDHKLNKRNTIESIGEKTNRKYVYTYKILEADLLQVAQVMGLENDIDITEDIGMANAVLVTSSELKQNSWIRGIAKFHQLPIFVIKSSTMAQMVKAVRMILGIESLGQASKLPQKNSADIEIEDDAPKRKPTLEEIDALEEVRLAIEYIVIPGGEPVELLPRRSDIIARQLKLVESYQLAAEHSGTELSPRLQILPHRLDRRSSSRPLKPISLAQNGIPLDSLPGNSGGTSVSRLPLLPE